MSGMNETDEFDQITGLFRRLLVDITDIAGKDDPAPGLYARSMAWNFGWMLGAIECTGCQAVIADLVNETLAMNASRWHLVGPDSETPKRHLH